MQIQNATNKIEIEYTKHQLKKISNGITERIGAQKTEILLIKNNGDTKYTITEKGYPQPDIRSNIDEKNLDKIKALIKETGFIAIPSNSFSISAVSSGVRRVDNASFNSSVRA